MVGPPSDQPICFVGNERSDTAALDEKFASLRGHGFVFIQSPPRSDSNKANTVSHFMYSKRSIYVIAYGGLLIVLGLLTHRTAPEIAKPTLMTASAGGALCVLWGVLGLLGRRWKVGFILTVAITSFLLLSQAVTSWMGHDSKPGGVLAASLMTLMLVVSVGLLMYLLHTDEPSSEPAVGARDQHDPSGGPNHPSPPARVAKNSPSQSKSK